MPADCRKKCSTDFVLRWLPTAPSSTEISRQVPSSASTEPVPRSSEGVIQNWWRQAMMGSIKAQYDCIKALSETDFTEDLKSIGQPTLILHGDDDQIVPIGGFVVACREARA